MQTVTEDWTLPTFQARSSEKRNNLIAAGLKLIEQNPYPKLRISDIADEAGCSVGTFYRRFHDKRSFLFALQEVANRNFLDRLQEKLRETTAPEDVILTTVRVLVADRRARRGLATASLRQATAEQDVWMPFYRAAVGVDRLLQARLTPGNGGTGPRKSLFEISFATQAMYGILNQVTLIRSGAVVLDDDALIDHLTRMCLRYLGLPAPAGGKG